MAYGLEAMTGVIPTVFVAGVAMKMADRLFSSQESYRERRPRRSRRQRPYRQERRTGMGFGNFSNLGF